MRIPATPPHFLGLVREMASDPSRLVAITRQVAGPLISGKYLHWDKLRYYPCPPGLSLEEWWFGIKTRRRGSQIRLLDKSGSPFTYCLVDPIQESLHEMDFIGGGNVQMPEQILNKETKNSYVVRSLIEEAFTSSQLEGAASTRKIAKELIRKERVPRDRGERMILNNFRTMQRITEFRNEPFSKSLICEIQRLVTEDALDDPSGAGRFRRHDEHRVVGDEEGRVFHEPPDANELEHRMEKLCAFANDAEGGPFIHPAVKSMIIHFWLAYDHPFVDGNGRTARALFYWSMLKHGYWLFEFLSISHVILRSSVAYGRAFLHTETDENDLTYFIIYHTSVIKSAIGDLNSYIERRSSELKGLESGLRGLVSLNYRQKELIRHALRHPGVHYTVESHRASHNVSRQTSNNDLNQLESKGLLRRMRGEKEHAFVATEDLERRLRDRD